MWWFATGTKILHLCTTWNTWNYQWWKMYADTYISAATCKYCIQERILYNSYLSKLHITNFEKIILKLKSSCLVPVTNICIVYVAFSDTSVRKELCVAAFTVTFLYLGRYNAVASGGRRWVKQLPSQLEADIISFLWQHWLGVLFTVTQNWNTIKLFT